MNPKQLLFTTLLVGSWFTIEGRGKKTLQAPAPEPTTNTSPTDTSPNLTGTCSNDALSTCEAAADCPKECDSKTNPEQRGEVCSDNSDCPPNTGPGNQRGGCKAVASVTCILASSPETSVPSKAPIVTSAPTKAPVPTIAQNKVPIVTNTPSKAPIVTSAPSKAPIVVTSAPTQSPVDLPALTSPYLAAPESTLVQPFGDIKGFFFDATSVSYFKRVSINKIRFRPTDGLTGPCRLHTISPAVGISAKDFHSSSSGWFQVHNTLTDTTLDGGYVVELTLSTPLDIGPSETRPIHLYCESGVDAYDIPGTSTNTDNVFTELVSDDSLSLSNSLATPTEVGNVDSYYPGAYSPAGLLVGYDVSEETLPLCPETDTSRFTLCLDAEVPPGSDPSWTKALGKARARWEQVIKGDLSTYYYSQAIDPNPDYRCPNPPEFIDDLYVCAKNKPIAEANVLGFATMRFVRPSTSSTPGLPITGYMQFDTEHVDSLKATGQWDGVILHELGHIIGVGSLWEKMGLVDAKSEFTGANACSEWQALTGCSSCPPVEDNGSAGTLGKHWEEDGSTTLKAMDHELMTGYVEASNIFMPLSSITVASIEDTGYQVDYSKADPYNNHPTCRRRASTLRGGSTSSDGNIRYLQPEHAISNRPQLSPAGKAKAKAFGRLLLAKDRRSQSSNNGNPSTFDAPQIEIGQSLSLAYKENDVIYFVGVSCAKSSESCTSNDDCCSDRCNMKEKVCEASSR